MVDFALEDGLQLKLMNVLWQQAAAAVVPLNNEPKWPAQPYSLPIPNAILREASSVSEMDAFFAIGEAWGHMVAHFLPENPFVLDLGCGCGKLARFLYLNPRLRYLGVDLFLPGIEWSRNAFTPLAGDRFRFEHFNGHSEVYNPQGTLKPSEYRLPCEDRTVDTVVCASLFTHLLEPDCVHYLGEIARVLKPSGKAIISLHTEPAPGSLFSGNEARIDIAPSYFLELAGREGLRQGERVGLVYGQDVHVLELQTP
ncbi:MAG: class I SAM-dependent methyltransferase [Bryobacteraceae bacterium]|jgi:SAM-dependent methyltransferase